MRSGSAWLCAASVMRLYTWFSYGRSDLRVCSRTGEVYLLEINPNCGLFYPNKDGTADVIMELDPFGADNVARHLIQAAINRNNRRIARVRPGIRPGDSESFDLRWLLSCRRSRSCSTLTRDTMSKQVVASRRESWYFRMKLRLLRSSRSSTLRRTGTRRTSWPLHNTPGRSRTRYDCADSRPGLLVLVWL